MISRPKIRLVPLALAVALVAALAAPLSASVWWFVAHGPGPSSVDAGDSVSGWISVATSNSCSNFDFSFQKLSGPSWITHTDLGSWAGVDAAPPASTTPNTYAATWRVTGTSTCGMGTVDVSWQVTVQ